MGTSEKKAPCSATASVGLRVEQHMRPGWSAKLPFGSYDVKVNADQARLCNLFKLALDEADGEFSPATIAHVEDLIRDIREVQEMMHPVVSTLHYKLHPQRRRRGKAR